MQGEHPGSLGKGVKADGTSAVGGGILGAMFEPSIRGPKDDAKLPTTSTTRMPTAAVLETPHQLFLHRRCGSVFIVMAVESAILVIERVDVCS